MDFTAFLSPSDAGRAARTFVKAGFEGTETLVLTGGLAVELHGIARGQAAALRKLNDIDLLVESFDRIPTALADHFVFRHVHPHDAPGKTLLQGVDPETGVRVDVFRAYGCEMERATRVDLCGVSTRMVSLEDLTARSARLCMDLAARVAVPARHTRDFARLLPLVEMAAMEPVWEEHRKPSHPALFAHAARLLTDLIERRKDLQIAPVYSQDSDARCPRCEGTRAFPLADGRQVLAFLGYC